MEKKIFKILMNSILIFLLFFCLAAFFFRLNSDAIMAKVFLYFSTVFLVLIFRANKTFKDGVWSRKKFVFLFSPGCLALILGFAWASYQKNNINEMISFLIFALICIISPLLMIWSEKDKNNIKKSVNKN